MDFEEIAANLVAEIDADFMWDGRVGPKDAENALKAIQERIHLALSKAYETGFQDGVG